MNRRNFMQAAGIGAIAATASCQNLRGQTEMYGIIGKMMAVDGKRDELISILIDGTRNMPGCLNYIVSKDNSDEVSIWITEIWDSQESHEASLSLESVQQAIAKGRSIIDGFGERIEITPIAG